MGTLARRVNGGATFPLTSPLALLDTDALGQYFARQLFIVEGIPTEPAAG